MIALGIKVLLAYLLGSVSGSMVIGKLRDVDIRSSGSGNAGGTNAFRTQGFLFALAVVIIDIGKGALAAWGVPQLPLGGIGEPVAPLYQAMACGFAAVIGHCYPIWFGFRGGKGAATAVGALAVIQPAVLVPMFLVWLLTLVLTGWVGLATVLSGISLVPSFALLDPGMANVAFACLLALFILFTHRENIARLARGTENRFERIRLVNWFRRD